MTDPQRPRRIEWTGPDQWTVWADEDGCHLRSARGDALEQCDVDRLFALYHQAREEWAAGTVSAPRPPLRSGGGYIGEQQIARRVIRAVKAELDADTDTPF